MVSTFLLIIIYIIALCAFLVKIAECYYYKKYNNNNKYKNEFFKKNTFNDYLLKRI